VISNKGTGLGEYYDQYFEKNHPIATIEYKKKMYQLVPFRTKFKNFNSSNIIWRLYRPENLNLIMNTTPYLEIWSLKPTDHPAINHLFNQLRVAAKIQLQKGFLDHMVWNKGIVSYPHVDVIDMKNKYSMRFSLPHYRAKKSNRHFYLGWGFYPNINKNKRIMMFHSKFAYRNKVFGI
jgi:hypothetical protein